MKNQLSIKINEQERAELEQLKGLLNIKDCYGDDPRAYKQAVRLAIGYLNQELPTFKLYEQLFVDGKKKLFTDQCKPLITQQSTKIYTK